MEYIMQGKDVDITYLDAGLHVDFDKLAGSLADVLNDMAGDDISLVIGNECHPEMEKIAASCNGRVAPAKNCIEMLLGDKMAEMNSEAKTFYLTSGWLENWRKIFVEGLKWDEIDARQNFGFYDRLLLLDTGLSPIEDEKILEFYEYTQVPVEVMPIDLANFRKMLEEALNG
jgi:hypothetical protein